MKVVLLFIQLLSFGELSIGQEISKFFVPAKPYNKVILVHLDTLSTQQIKTVRNIFYVRKEDGYDVTDALFVQGQASSIITRSFIFTSDEVKLAKSISTNLIETNSETNYEQPEEFLKMPLPGQKAYWAIEDPTEGVTKYITSWETVLIDKKPRQCIKLIKASFKTNGNFLGKIIEYYVYGIGLYKTEIEVDGNKSNFYKFDKLEFDPQVASSSTNSKEDYSLPETKITSIKAQLFYNENKSGNVGKNISGTFSNNIIDNNEIALWNTVIGEGSAEGCSKQTIVIVEITSIGQSNKNQILKFVATANNKIINQQQQTFSCIGNNTTYKLLFLLNNTGCDEIFINADLIQNQKIISTMNRKIDFQCGE